MNDLKSQMHFERLKVAVAVQQTEVLFDAHPGDQTVNGAPDRDAPVAKIALIADGWTATETEIDSQIGNVLKKMPRLKPARLGRGAFPTLLNPDH